MDMAQEKRDVLTPSQIRQIQTLAETLHYGSITLTFQDGALIQIDKNEKIRITKA